MEWKEHLKSIYFDLENSVSYSGPTKIHRYLKKEGKYKVGLSAIKQWLQDIDAYSLQRPQRYKFKTNRVISQGIDFLWDADLADVNSITKENDDLKFLLVTIDDFSRYAWVRPLKNKKHESIIDALKDIFEEGRIPSELRTDKGSEWINRWTKQYLKRKDVQHFATQNVTHANYAERFIRTLKVMMYRYFTHNRTYRYVEVLQDIVRNYNNRPHRSLNGLSPSDVNKTNEDILWMKLYVDVLKPTVVRKKNYKPHKRFKFKVGDYVRLSGIKHTFQRDYEQKWTEEVFIVNRKFLRQGIPVYKVVDYSKDPIDGTFYEAELQRVNKTRDDLWKIEKVLKRRKRRGQTEVLVKWQGYPRKFNSWVNEDELQDI
ncbi:uncharacterized protein LOC134229907 [Saccostrea cucullata]|uniref:uncharacterized protein LOC134229907 n=1 Tax=Saccostrea cuccullata TaxID=36930 RepID=UPI002ED15B95